MEYESTLDGNLPRECRAADILFMKYLDHTLTKEDSEKLHDHIGSCKKCKADFTAYESFAVLDNEIFEAPDGFVESVMAKLESVPMKKTSSDSAVYTAWAVFSVLFGIGLLLFLNKNSIISVLESIPSLAAYAEIIKPLSAITDNFVGSVSGSVTMFFSSVTGFISVYAPVIAGISAIACVLLIVFNRKRLFNK